jgi:hypothetical protein
MSPVSKKTKRAPAVRTSGEAPLPPLPHLAAFLSGYLHEDFGLDYDSPSAAVAAFLSECNPAERRGLAKDWRTFSTATEEQPWRDVRRAFSALGGAWLPSSRAALRSAFSALS